MIYNSTYILKNKTMVCLRLVLGCIAAVGVLSFAVCLENEAIARTGGNGGGGGGGSTCSRSTCDRSVKECGRGGYAVCGATFVRYSTSDIPSLPTRVRDFAESEGIQAQCDPYGGEFYILGYAQMEVSGTTVVPTGHISRAFPTSMLANVIGPSGISYRSGAGVPYSTVETNFSKGKQAAATNPSFGGNFASLGWDNLTWFCWDESALMADASSEIQAFSVIEWNDGTNSGIEKSQDACAAGWCPNTNVNTTITTDQDEVDIELWHALNYTSTSASHPPAGSIFNPARIDVEYNIGGGRTIRCDSGYSGMENFDSYGPNTGSPFVSYSSIHYCENWVRVPAPAIGGSPITYCSEISTVEGARITWNKISSGEYTESRSVPRAESMACITIERGSGGTPTTATEQMHFWSTSKVEVKNISPAPDNDIDEGLAQATSRKWDDENDHDTFGDDKVTIKISTDQAQVKVKFSHQLYYRHEDSGGAKRVLTSTSSDKYVYTPDNICTNVSIGTDGSSAGVNPSSTPIEPKPCVTKNNGNEAIEINPEEFTINTPTPGSDDPVVVCQKITIDPKHLGLTETETYNRRTGVTTHAFSKSAAAMPSPNDTYSQACVEIWRPELPDHSDGPKSTGAGSSEGAPMYVGEYTDMTWWLHAYGMKTRRIMEYQSVAYEVEVSDILNSGKTLGNFPANNPNSGVGHGGTGVHNTSKPCDYWGGKFSIRGTKYPGCAKITANDASKEYSDGYPDNNGNDKLELGALSPSASMVVPDYTGDKYCNSTGIKWQYYYGEFHEPRVGTINPVWTPGNWYWTHYSSACRSIAKKPSTMIWNDSLFVGKGNVVTSLASRYNTTAVGTIKPASADKHFGSWVEYLAAINSAMSAPDTNFASGAALSLGSDTDDLADNSPLTIANSGGSIGNSGIDRQSTYLNRLGDYLWNKGATDSVTGKVVGTLSELQSEITTLSSPSATTRNTIILSTDQPISIDLPIALPDITNSIYSLPQIIIYTSSNSGISISGSVKQIDAWLVAPKGTINTCSDFNDDKIAADVEDNIAGANTACSNQLIINGPVIAKNLKLNRTYGAERYDDFSSTGNGTLASPISRPGGNDVDAVNTAAGGQVQDSGTGNGEESRSAGAEIFNMSADVYLWAYAQAGRYNSSYTEAYIRELPPRY